MADCISDAAASALRLALARTYGRADMCTARQWHVVPCLTPDGTVGILDLARGTAWDTGIVAPELEPEDLHGAVYAAANMPSGGGPVRIDGELVQADGTHVEDGRPVPPTMPADWRQVLLPTWKGYEGDGSCRVPTALFRPEHWVRPRLAAAGLLTCYGKPGSPVDGEWLARTHGHGHVWPWGVPPWIEGESVTVLGGLQDLLWRCGANLDVVREEHEAGLYRAPRGTDAEESERVRQAIARRVPLAAQGLREDARTVEREWSARSHKRREWALTATEVGECQRLALDAARALEREGAGAVDLSSPLWHLLGIAGNACGVYRGRRALELRRAHDLLEQGLPWDAARALEVF